MKDQKEDVSSIQIHYLDENGIETYNPHNPQITCIRLSIFVTKEDSHHIQIKKGESRYRLSGMLHRLAQSLAEGV